MDSAKIFTAACYATICAIFHIFYHPFRIRKDSVEARCLSHIAWCIIYASHMWLLSELALHLTSSSAEIVTMWHKLCDSLCVDSGVPGSPARADSFYWGPNQPPRRDACVWPTGSISETLPGRLKHNRNKPSFNTEYCISSCHLHTFSVGHMDPVRASATSVMILGVLGLYFMYIFCKLYNSL